MLREYCDKCGNEIDRAERRDRNRVDISLPDAGINGTHATVVLCQKCYEGLGIKKAVEDTGASDYREKSGTAERLLEIIKEIASESILEELQ